MLQTLEASLSRTQDRPPEEWDYEDGSEEIFEEGGEVYRPESEGGDIDCEFACSASVLALLLAAAPSDAMP
jgi:hypothetical protein